MLLHLLPTLPNAFSGFLSLSSGPSSCACLYLLVSILVTGATLRPPLCFQCNLTPGPIFWILLDSAQCSSQNPTLILSPNSQNLSPGKHSALHASRLPQLLSEYLTIYTMFAGCVLTLTQCFVSGADGIARDEGFDFLQIQIHSCLKTVFF